MLVGYMKDILGPKGLVSCIKSQTAANFHRTTLLKMGDYLALLLRRLKAEELGFSVWKQSNLDWVEVSILLEKEIAVSKA